MRPDCSRPFAARLDRVSSSNCWIAKGWFVTATVALLVLPASCTVGGPPAGSSSPVIPEVSTEPPPGPGAETPPAAVSALALDQPPRLCESPDPATRYSAASGCPVTLRLQARLRSLASGFDPVCRCQSRAPSVPIRPISATRVNAVMEASFGTAAAPNDVYFAVIKLGGRWFVDDTNCSDPSTSVYVDPLPRCH